MRPYAQRCATCAHDVWQNEAIGDCRVYQKDVDHSDRQDCADWTARPEGRSEYLWEDEGVAGASMTGERFRKMISAPENVRKIFDRLDHEGAFLPYYPEMLDFEMAENLTTETDEINTYHAAFAT